MVASSSSSSREKKRKKQKKKDDEHKGCSCPYCPVEEDHPAFLTLMSTRMKDYKSSQEPVSRIFVSFFPLIDLRSHNREKGYKVGPKNTKPLAGKWSVELFIGPFRLSEAKQYLVTWKRSSSKSLIDRIKKGAALYHTAKSNLKRKKLSVYTGNKDFFLQTVQAAPAPAQ